MANIYEAYQQYLSDIGEYVPSVDDVYSGVPRLASTIQNAGITGITGIKDALLPSGDDGNQGPPGPPGSPGTGGIAGLIDQYNNAGFLGRAPVNMGISMFAPQLAAPLAMYNIGKSIYDFGGDVFGYTDPKGLHQIDVPNYAQYIDPDRYDGVTDPSNVSFSENPGIGFSNTDGDIESYDYGDPNSGGENDPGNTEGDYDGDDDE
jgi:hypothetical protein